MFKSVSLHNQSVLKLGTESMAMITETRPWQPRRRRNHQRWNQRKLRLWLFELKSYKHRVTLWLQFVALYTAAFYSTTLGLWLRKVWLLCAGLIAAVYYPFVQLGLQLLVTCCSSVLNSNTVLLQSLVRRRYDTMFIPGPGGGWGVERTFVLSVVS